MRGAGRTTTLYLARCRSQLDIEAHAGIRDLGCRQNRWSRLQHPTEVAGAADHDVPAPPGDFVVTDEAQHRVHVGGMRAYQLRDRERRVRGARDSLLTRPAVLAEVTALRRNATRPVLGVDDEHAARPDHHVVDVGEASPRPTDVVKRRPFARQAC